MWKTDPKTIQRALTPLVSEGLLERTPGAGTFVRQPEAQLTCVAVYALGSATAQGESPFGLALQAELRRELLAQGIEPDVWVDPRPEPANHEPWEVLARAARQRRVQAVIMPSTGWPSYNWVSKLPVPTSFLGSARRPNVVHGDLRQMAELCVTALADQGCRSIGLISAYARDNQDEPGSVHESVEYHQYFREVAAARGLRVDERWIRDPREGETDGRLSQERFGYEQFHSLWDLPELPEGLIVDVDTMSQGVVKALLERRVRVPEELKLVLGRNAHVDFLCPLPASYCVTDETALARALIESVQKQFRGEPCETMYIAPTVSPSPNGL